MTAYEKPRLGVSEIEEVLRKHFGPGAAEITPLTGGNLSTVFSFVHESNGYVVKFSELEDAYQTEGFVSDLLSGQGVTFPRCLALGRYGPLSYIIMERMGGRNLADYTVEQQASHLPELISILTRLAGVDVESTKGFGWIGPDGNGAYASWKDFVIACNAEDQTGTFWENWHDLYRTSCLERDVYEEIYNRLMSCISYNEPHRGFIHGDFHQWNILSNGDYITGIIDGNYMYGDSLVDLAILDRHMPWSGAIKAYQGFQAKCGITIPNFNERLIGAYYFKGLDGLRFYAKMGWKDAYQSIRHFLLNLES
ncbi:phosphotransferase family protein [Paenibacillus sp. MMO-177]|uniref:phosphotransferase family protein n=1 Tax=Paenibacillus sp. MMO-177 TaxID=3081289 RepID=UPI0030181FE9